MPFINGIGPGELIIILIIALIVVGPGKLPDVGSALGKSIREFRKAATDVKESVSLDPAPAPTAQQTAATPAPAPQVAATASVAAPPVVPMAAVPAAEAVAPAAEAVAPAASAAGDAAAEGDAPAWPAEVTPADEQQPTASA